MTGSMENVTMGLVTSCRIDLGHLDRNSLRLRCGSQTWLAWVSVSQGHIPRVAFSGFWRQQQDESWDV